MAIKKGDFVEVEFTGMLEDGTVFDTTDEKVAKESNIYDERSEYGSIIVCIGEGHLLKGVDKNLEGKELGKEYEFKLAPEDGFGKKDTKLLRLIATNKFLKQNIMPQPGLQVSIDGIMGTVKTVTGGRVIVDLNHPLAGRELVYKVKPIRMITDSKEKVTAIIKLRLGVKDAEISIEDSECKIKLKQKLQKELGDALSEEIKKLTGIKTAAFVEPEKEKKEEKKEEKEAEHKEDDKAQNKN